MESDFDYYASNADLVKLVRIDQLETRICVLRGIIDELENEIEDLKKGDLK